MPIFSRKPTVSKSDITAFILWVDLVDEFTHQCIHHTYVKDKKDDDDDGDTGFLTRALKRVDLPTLGNPTMPLRNAMLTLPHENSLVCLMGSNLSPTKVEFEEDTKTALIGALEVVEIVAMWREQKIAC